MSGRRRGGWALALLVAGCGCKPDPTRPAAASDAGTAASVGVGFPPTSRWARTPPSEPDPAAKGLYRRMIDRASAGDAAGAVALAEQIRRDYPDSRFAVRLSGEASPAGVLGAVLLVGAVAVPFIKRGADAEAKAPGGPAGPASGAPAGPSTP